jgi:hypothetical protein
MQTHITPAQKLEILNSVDAAKASIARGEGRTITRESMRQLARDGTSAVSRSPGFGNINTELTGRAGRRLLYETT